jgi:hypothetical protein
MASGLMGGFSQLILAKSLVISAHFTSCGLSSSCALLLRLSQKTKNLLLHLPSKSQKALRFPEKTDPFAQRGRLLQTLTLFHG